MPERSAAAVTPACGRVFEIQRFSLHDGPGIRTTVFLKGCPLHCRWCHNPEGIDERVEVAYQADACIDCGACIAVCPSGAQRWASAEAATTQSAAATGGDSQTAGNAHRYDRSRCTRCGACTDICWAGALTLTGRLMSVESILAIVAEDGPFAQESTVGDNPPPTNGSPARSTYAGRLTVSGGEPLHQAAFTAALCRRARELSMHTCIETSGYAPQTAFDAVAPFVDLWLFDIKNLDDHRHRLHTGVSNRMILRNLRQMVQNGAAVRLRAPVIPGFNDDRHHFQALARLLETLPGVAVEVMPYHRLGTAKDRRYGYAPRTDLPPASATAAQTATWVRRLQTLGATVVNENSIPKTIP